MLFQDPAFLLYFDVTVWNILYVMYPQEYR